jgi:hypothetical protein
MAPRLRGLVVGILAVTPSAVDWIAKNVLWPRPFWVWFYDPETAYFYNGLRLLRGQLPDHVDHPGTTLQVLSAAIAAVSGPSPLRYEQFLAVAHLVSLVLTLAATFLMLATVFRDAPAALQLAGAWTCLIAPQALDLGDVWGPEAMYAPIAAVVFALLWRCWKEPAPVTAALSGLTIGLAIATKFTFLAWLPAALAALVVARRFREGLLLVVSAAVGFAIGTIPAVPEYGQMFHRLVVLGTHPRDHMRPGAWLVLTAKAWCLWVAIIVAFAATRLRRQHLPILTFVTLAVGLNLVAMLRNASFKHLLPACLAVVLLFAAAASTAPRPRLLVQAALLAMCAVLTAKAIVEDIGTHRRRIAAHLALQAQIRAVVPRDAVTLYSWGVPMPSLALRILSSDPRDRAEVERRYPLDGHFDSNRGHFDERPSRVFLPSGARRWEYLVIALDDLREFPEPVGRTVAQAGSYLIVRAPDHAVP